VNTQAPSGPPLPPVRPAARRRESLARILTAGLLLGLCAALLLVIPVWRGSSDGVIELVARQPAAGGWSRERIVVNQGERVRLRIRSEDVVHGFSIGRLGVDAGPIEPGKVTSVEFVADQPGEFTFYCTMWCDPNHARMRGILEVRGRAVAETARPDSASDLLLQHLDEPRDAGVVPQVLPSAARGLPLYRQGCASCHGERGEGTVRAAAVGRQGALWDRSPVDVFWMLAQPRKPQGMPAAGAHDRRTSSASRTVPPHPQVTRGWGEQDRWDAVASLWSLGTTPERSALGERLYRANCAACHGERGRGDGPGGKSQPRKPVDFTDARRMLAGTSELYTAKIRRGGMGTGMPYWGSIFTEEELTALVDHVWTFSLTRRE
jgi:cytochrome c oxidase subunit 2